MIDQVVVCGCPGILTMPGVRPWVPVETPSFGDQPPLLSVHVPPVLILINTRVFSAPVAVPAALIRKVTYSRFRLLAESNTVLRETAVQLMEVTAAVVGILVGVGTAVGVGVGGTRVGVGVGVGGGVTVTLPVSCMPSMEAVITTVPGDRPSTKPLRSTVATAGLEEDQVNADAGTS